MSFDFNRNRQNSPLNAGRRSIHQTLPNSMPVGLGRSTTDFLGFHAFRSAKQNCGRRDPIFVSGRTTGNRSASSSTNSLFQNDDTGTGADDDISGSPDGQTPGADGYQKAQTTGAEPDRQRRQNNLSRRFASVIDDKTYGASMRLRGGRKLAWLSAHHGRRWNSRCSGLGPIQSGGF